MLDREHALGDRSQSDSQSPPQVPRELSTGGRTSSGDVGWLGLGKLELTVGRGETKACQATPGERKHQPLGAIPVPPLDSEANRWFSENVHPHEPMLRAWLRSRFPGLDDIDDVVQQAYERILTVWPEREIRSPKAFLFAIARNIAYDRYRRIKVAATESLGDFDEFSVLDDAADVVETVARNQEIELMTQAIQKLPDHCRRVLTLRYVYGLPRQDIADKLGISVRTVEAHITEGIKRCSRYLAKFKGR